MDIEYNVQYCGDGFDCLCDYVEILGQRYCGNWKWTGELQSCSMEVRFSSDETFSYSGFRLEWEEIPDDGER